MKLKGMQGFNLLEFLILPQSLVDLSQVMVEYRNKSFRQSKKKKKIPTRFGISNLIGYNAVVKLRRFLSLL